MPRELKLQTQEVGLLSVVAIREEEPLWQQIAGTPLTAHLSYVRQEDFDHALYGWVRPLVLSLGPPPRGALAKLAHTSKPVCALHKRCSTWRREVCHLKSKEIPACFELADHPSSANEVIRWWQEGTYVLCLKP